MDLTTLENLIMSCQWKGLTCTEDFFFFYTFHDDFIADKRGNRTY